MLDRHRHFSTFHGLGEYDRRINPVSAFAGLTNASHMAEAGRSTSRRWLLLEPSREQLCCLSLIQLPPSSSAHRLRSPMRWLMSGIWRLTRLPILAGVGVLWNAAVRSGQHYALGHTAADSRMALCLAHASSSTKWICSAILSVLRSRIRRTRSRKRRLGKLILRSREEHGFAGVYRWCRRSRRGLICGRCTHRTGNVWNHRSRVRAEG